MRTAEKKKVMLKKQIKSLKEKKRGNQIKEKRKNIELKIFKKNKSDGIYSPFDCKTLKI